MKWREFRGREDISGKVRKAKDTIRQITWRKRGGGELRQAQTSLSSTGKHINTNAHKHISSSDYARLQLQR